MAQSRNEIDFLGHKINVVFSSPGKSSPLESNDFGLWSLDDMTMYINRDVREDLQVATILHEALHIMQHLLDVEIDHKDVQIVSQGIYHLIKNNKWIFDMISGHSGE